MKKTTLIAFGVVILVLGGVCWYFQNSKQLVNQPDTQTIIKNKSSNPALLSEIDNQKVFVSHIHKDKELGELFVETTDGNITQISNKGQNISAILVDKQRQDILYAQSQNDDKIPKIIEPLIINAPGRFSQYTIFLYDIENNKTQELLHLSANDIIGTVSSMGFLHQGKTLAFQTHYGKIYLLDMDNPQKVSAFVPAENYPNQSPFDDMYDMKTDGDKHIIFDAKSGNKSDTDGTFVYNTFIYNLDTHKLEKITNNPFFYKGDEEPTDQSQ